MFGYYPYASKATGYTSGRKEVGVDKDSWAQHFKKNGYHSARISKIFHMGFLPTSQRAVTGPTIRNHGMRPTTAKARKRR